MPNDDKEFREWRDRITDTLENLVKKLEARRASAENGSGDAEIKPDKNARLR